MKICLIIFDCVPNPLYKYADFLGLRFACPFVDPF
jgi:hypothetical protein